MELAGDLARPHGWRGPTARELWDQRAPLSAAARSAFLATVAQGRAAVRAHWNLPPQAALAHGPSSAVDRRAVRDALAAHDLLRIEPRRPRRRRSVDNPTTPLAQSIAGAGTITEAHTEPLSSTCDTALAHREQLA